ncbi:hypothetical protein TNCV_3334141 [Trichonephila clavipes]|nr:hypothetical protein TNCV_3334141 [Trichonephila clavipes]
MNHLFKTQAALSAVNYYYKNKRKTPYNDRDPIILKVIFWLAVSWDILHSHKCLQFKQLERLFHHIVQYISGTSKPHDHIIKYKFVPYIRQRHVEGITRILLLPLIRMLLPTRKCCHVHVARRKKMSATPGLDNPVPSTSEHKGYHNHLTLKGWAIDISTERVVSLLEAQLRS